MGEGGGGTTGPIVNGPDAAVWRWANRHASVPLVPIAVGGAGVAVVGLVVVLVSAQPSGRVAGGIAFGFGVFVAALGTMLVLRREAIIVRASGVLEHRTGLKQVQSLDLGAEDEVAMVRASYRSTMPADNGEMVDIRIEYLCILPTADLSRLDWSGGRRPDRDLICSYDLPVESDDALLGALARFTTVTTRSL